MAKAPDRTHIVPTEPKAVEEAKAVVLEPSKTPMFNAIHTSRYERHALIKEINQKQGKPLICYICGAGTLIGRDDTVFFVDLLHNVSKGVGLDLMIHTGGGDVD